MDRYLDELIDTWIHRFSVDAVRVHLCIPRLQDDQLLLRERSLGREGGRERGSVGVIL